MLKLNDIAQVQEKLLRIREKENPGVSVREFARKARISPNQVARMEGRLTQHNYKRDPGASPTIERLRLYLAACNYTLGKFFSEIEKVSYPENISDDHAELHGRLQSLLDSGEDAERRIKEQLQLLEIWLVQGHPTGREGKDSKEGLVTGRHKRKQTRKAG